MTLPAGIKAVTDLAVEGKRVFVRADRRLDVQSLMDVLDALKSGGVENAGIVTEFPEE